MGDSITIKDSKKINAKKERSSNLEIFRIIVMLLIIAHHYVVNSGLTGVDGPIYAAPTSWKSLFLLAFAAFGKTGINCFVMITGYFMCKSSITAKKFAKLLAEVMFYKIVFYLIFLATGYVDFSIKELAKVILPFVNIQQNFTGCYLIFFLCIPFLNKLIHNINERQHIKLILICAFTYILFETVPFFHVDMNYVSWYIVLYFIASYIRMYPKNLFQNKKIWGWMTILFIALAIVSVVACAWLSSLLNMQMAFLFVTDANTFLAVALGVCSFLFFKNIEMKNKKFINSVAASTFGVLLIHSNSGTMRQWLWTDLLKNVEMYSSDWMPIHAIGSVVGIFLICTVIDNLRIRFIEKPVFNKADAFWERLSEWYENIETKVCNKLHIKGE